MSVVTITLFICLSEVSHCILVCFRSCSPFPFAIRDDSHLAFLFVYFLLQHFLLWCWCMVRLVSRLFLFSVNYLLFMNCCGMAKANMATVRFKTP
ncbi:hypothetical protein ACN42_g8258 [Penicillium freii]|uniref:Uncharacterized protein n=1 Tax=Penicillium freii TaxID=48697 RepID=A0A101ME34_PENFR|nr:hypothetical protein ACN42_g8258 [Penicillium freii]